MAKDFNATTSKITTSYTTHGTQRTYSIWTYREGEGEGGLGRIFEKRTAGAQVELFFTNNNPAGEDKYQYERAFSGGAGQWTFTRPAANEWHNIIITYDSSDPANDPVFYIDGVSQSLKNNTNSSGTANTNTDPYVIGNRGNDDARTWDGGLCEFAIWDRILSVAEITATGKGYSPLFFLRSLVFYAPLINTSQDLKGTGALTDANVTAIAHPRIIYPSPAQIRKYTTVAAASTRNYYRSLL